MITDANSGVPPQPDTHGYPVPPRAAIVEAFTPAAEEPGTVEQDRTTAQRPPADGQPVVAWRYTGTRTTLAHWVAVIPLAVVVTVVLWRVDPSRALPTLLGGVVFALICGRRRTIAVGAHWFSFGERYVATYELQRVTVLPGVLGLGAGPGLRLTDRHGATVTVALRDVQSNRKLWDYLYLGIVYSVATQGAQLNNRAYRMLNIDPGSRTVGLFEQNPRGRPRME